MRMVDLIAKKRDGGVLSKTEIDFIIEGYTKGEIPDYQLSAWAMAVYFKGMTSEEVANLTMAMTLSGDTVDLSPIEGVKVDKHSTGGVGDTTTIILAPLVAAAGIPVAKMSGRGLGHTGGTIDKLEAIPGFHVELSAEEFIHNVNEFKIAVIGQSGNLTPADKKLYGLRDVTATVDSIPLIASSIMSKKIAAGADAIVLDVKTGAGAFMKSLDEARALASAMVDIGRELGRHTVAIISDMSQPLGYAVGNSLEIKEAIDTLRGEGPEDLTRLVLTLGAHMVVLGGKAESFEEGYQLLEELIHSGKALEVLKQFVVAQGGTAEVIDDPEKLPQAPYQVHVTAPVDGYIHAIQAEEIGVAAMQLGAGRPTKESSIDLAVGVVLTKKVGHSVRQGETIAILHANQEDVAAIAQKIERAFVIQSDACEESALIYDIIQ
ncbi:pyrimidine-nucleoside phosphorylase [Paenibacillus planticolens]|uniref:Pyrimidine-nucleoside phosphorylase n=1 Tax=Paenibacillus planticolens TaxID=2654976 RepID=A0ABX1ZI96_9BACL|nr:pyrimidine-nucleoside phosphorylase [Paenibacillus planticolens]NOU99813.1 pyrimidine-nucleoside phosphorylase [Paenibacillus planticolens]